VRRSNSFDLPRIECRANRLPARGNPGRGRQWRFDAWRGGVIADIGRKPSPDHSLDRIAGVPATMSRATSGGRRAVSKIAIKRGVKGNACHRNCWLRGGWKRLSDSENGISSATLGADNDHALSKGLSGDVLDLRERLNAAFAKASRCSLVAPREARNAPIALSKSIT
jgi:hypothetical protein